MDLALEYRLFLHHPDKEELCEIIHKNLAFSQRFGDFNTLSFDIPYYDNDWEMQKDERFDMVDGLNLIKLSIYKGLASIYDEFFVITDPNRSYDGTVSKTVSCYPMEYIPFNKRRLRNYEKKTVLYDAANPTDSSAGLLNYICIKILYGTWSVAYISPSLASISRTWSYSSSSLTETFKDVEKQLDCYIRFNNVLNTISVYATDELGVDLDMVLSDSNYITRISRDDKITDITTRVSCYGKNNITMAAYNPTGLPYVDNFSYALNNGRMSADLTAALEAYQTLTDAKTIECNAQMASRAIYSDSLALARAQRTALNADLDIIEDDLDILKDEHPTETAAYTARYADKVAKEAAIASKTTEIEGIEDNISVIDAAIVVINQDLSFEGHFTLTQLKELNGFILEEELSLDTITDSQLLYEYGKAYADKKATPSVELTVNLLDLLSDSEQEPDWNNIVNGCGNYILVDCTDISLNYHKTKIMQIDHNPDANTLSGILSNSDKIKKAINFMATEIWQKSRQAALKVEVNQYDYKAYITESATLVRTGTNIDASTTPIIAPGTVLNRRGLLGTNIGSNGVLQMLKDKIILSKDNFETYNTLLSGNGLYIERKDKGSRIVIDVDYGIQIDLNIGTYDVPIWNNILYFEAATKKFIFNGTLSADVINAVKAEIDIVVTNITIVTNLYAENATVARLTVDELDTSTAVKKYLNTDVTDDNYQRITGMKHELITASTDGLDAHKVQATNRAGQPLYWTDINHTAADTTVREGLQVWTYSYTSAIKWKVYLYEHTAGYYVPIMKWGAGAAENPELDTCYMYKLEGAFWIVMINNDASELKLKLQGNNIVAYGNTGSYGIRNQGIGTSLPSGEGVQEGDFYALMEN